MKGFDNISLLISSVLLLGMATGCTTPDYLSENELVEYIANNEQLSRTVQSGKVSMKVTYRPSDLLVWQDVEGETDTLAIIEAFNRYHQYLYFMLSLAAGDQDALYGTSASQAEFNDKLQTLSFRMNQYVNLTTSLKDTIPLADAFYSRTFGLGKSNDVLLVFDKNQLNNANWVSVNTKEFGFKTGRKLFRYEMEDLNSLPGLTELKPFYHLTSDGAIEK